MIFSVNIFVNSKYSQFVFNDISSVKPCYTAIVLGASVSKEGELSPVLTDRMQTAIELYHKNKIKRFLLSGDHGSKQYDEVNSMKAYLLNYGIDSNNVFLDHAGFDTYNSLVRAKRIFAVHNAIIVTQEFHISRAVYIGRNIGIDAYGVKADRRQYRGMYRLKFRELFANIKAVYEVLFNVKPKFLGNRIPITGNSRLSYD